jgi:hypothetical protein
MNLKGKKIKLISMFDPYTDLKEGDTGIIRGVDDSGHILVDWDNGSRLNLIEGVDEYEILESLKYIKLFDSYNHQWDSSIRSHEVNDILPKIYQVQKFIHESGEDFDSKISSILKPFDKIVKEFITEMFLNNYWFSEKNDGLIDVIVELGDKIMNRYGTEPKQVINAIEDVISYFSRWLPHPDDLIEERKKAQRYKGKKIPGKYLTGPHPSKMKKEIDQFRGKDVYKKDWDADYKSGKGGKGKRVKTKKSAATKAYQRMFGDK